MLRERFETVLWSDKGGNSQSGFLSLTDVQYRPFMKACRFKGRIATFETDGTEAKIYAYESDVLYSGSVPGYSGKGCHFQINFYGDLNQVIHIRKRWKMSVEIWLSYMQTVYFQQPYLPDSSLSNPGVGVSKYTSQIILSL
jgi:hypothetical protein